MSASASAHGTSHRETVHWSQRGPCKAHPEEFSVTEIGGDITAVQDALEACGHCPVLQQCIAHTAALPSQWKPQEQVQAGRVWTKSTSVLTRLVAVCEHGVSKATRNCVPCEKRRERDRLRARRKRKRAGS